MQQRRRFSTLKLCCIASFGVAAYIRPLLLSTRVARFKSGDVTVLVATDLAARGLDITVSFQRCSG